jgi:hypothetical protein
MVHGIVKYSQELKYGHCLNCVGSYSRKSYARHRCITNKKSAKDLKRKATPIKAGDAALQLKLNKLSPEAANIMASISDDAVGTAAKNDLLAIKILEYRLKWGQGKEPNFKKQMRDKLRLLGGLPAPCAKGHPWLPQSNKNSDTSTLSSNYKCHPGYKEQEQCQFIANQTWIHAETWYAIVTR